MKITVKNVNRRLVSLALAGTLTFSLSACSVEMAGSVDSYDVLDTNSMDSEGLRAGVKQVLPVEGEDFSLVIEYYSNDSEWRINANKSLAMTIYTEGLTDKEVYIDTIHMDTSIVSTRAIYDGIKQDILDDHIHNSLMLGFPISDTNKYYGVNEIEGQNSEFIEGYSYGNSYYSSGSVTTKRRLESEFLEDGVYANRIDGVIGLLIVDPATGEVLRGVDVDTTLIVAVNNKITFEENGMYVTYEYDKYGNRKKIKEENILDTKVENKNNAMIRIKRYK